MAESCLMERHGGRRGRFIETPPGMKGLQAVRTMGLSPAGETSTRGLLAPVAAVLAAVAEAATVVAVVAVELVVASAEAAVAVAVAAAAASRATAGQGQPSA